MDHQSRRPLDHHHDMEVPIPSLFFVSILSLQQLVINMFITKFCQWLHSNCGPLLSEGTALPTEPQPRPRYLGSHWIVSLALLIVSPTFPWHFTACFSSFCFCTFERENFFNLFLSGLLTSNQITGQKYFFWWANPSHLPPFVIFKMDHSLPLLVYFSMHSCENFLLDAKMSQLLHREPPLTRPGVTL